MATASHSSGTWWQREAARREREPEAQADASDDAEDETPVHVRAGDAADAQAFGQRLGNCRFRESGVGLHTAGARENRGQDWATGRRRRNAASKCPFH